MHLGLLSANSGRSRTGARLACNRGSRHATLTAIHNVLSNTEAFLGSSPDIHYIDPSIGPKGCTMTPLHSPGRAA